MIVLSRAILVVMLTSLCLHPASAYIAPLEAASRLNDARTSFLSNPVYMKYYVEVSPAPLVVSETSVTASGIRKQTIKATIPPAGGTESITNQYELTYVSENSWFIRIMDIEANDQSVHEAKWDGISFSQFNGPTSARSHGSLVVSSSGQLAMYYNPIDLNFSRKPLLADQVISIEEDQREDRKYYIINVDPKAKCCTSHVLFTVDPGRSNSILESSSYAADGRLKQEQTNYDFQQLSNGIWFPMTSRVDSYSESGEIKRSITYRIQEIRYDEDLDISQCSIDPPMGTMVIDERIDTTFELKPDLSELQ